MLYLSEIQFIDCLLFRPAIWLRSIEWEGGDVWDEMSPVYSSLFEVYYLPFHKTLMAFEV